MAAQRKATKTRRQALASFETHDRPVRVNGPTEAMPYFSVTWYEPGKERQQRTTVGKVEAEAIEWATAKAEQLRRIQRTPKAERKFATVGDLVDDYMNPENHVEWEQVRTAEKALEVARKFITPEFRQIVTNSLTDEDVQLLLTTAKRSDPTDTRPLAQSYLQDGRSLLGAIIRFGVRHGYLEPAQLVADLKIPKVKGAGLKPEAEHNEDDEDDRTFTVNRLNLPKWPRIHELAEAMPSETTKLWVLFAASTGLRFGEMAALRWNDINLEGRLVKVDRKISESNRGQMRVELPKGGKTRVTAYPGWLAEMVATRVAEAQAEQVAEREAAEEAGVTLPDYSTGLMFPAPRGGWMRRSNFHTRVWRPAWEAAGWRRGWSPHTLRHSAAVAMIYELEMALVDAAEALGHADVSVTMRIYCQARDGAAERLAAASASTIAPW